MWVGLAMLMTAGLAACNKNASAEGPQYADVVSATPIKKTVNHPHQECHNEAVTEHKPVKDKHEILGTAIGAVAGGVLGNQVGGGNGKKLATAAGAVAGGYAGHKIQKHHQENATETTNKQVCKTVNNPTTNIVGYNVKYKYNGSVHTTRMDHDPGARVEVKNGVSVVSSNG
jgi:uncharacterized protein YcfJ